MGRFSPISSLATLARRAFVWALHPLLRAEMGVLLSASPAAEKWEKKLLLLLLFGPSTLQVLLQSEASCCGQPSLDVR